MIYIGIDPGGSGGIAIMEPDPTRFGGTITRTALKMPETERDIVDILERYDQRKVRIGNPMDPGLEAVAAIEHVWSTPGQGGAFKFGKSVGTLLGILAAVRIPFDQVLPRTWQKALGVAYPAGSSDTEKKNITKRRAQQLFPELTITHATADALLIAEYCRRIHGAIDGKTQGSSRTQGDTEARRSRQGKGGEGREGREAGAQDKHSQGDSTSRAPRHGGRADQAARRHRSGNR